MRSTRYSRPRVGAVHVQRARMAIPLRTPRYAAMANVFRFACRGQSGLVSQCCNAGGHRRAQSFRQEWQAESSAYIRCWCGVREPRTPRHGDGTRGPRYARLRLCQSRFVAKCAGRLRRRRYVCRRPSRRGRYVTRRAPRTRKAKRPQTDLTNHLRRTVRVWLNIAFSRRFCLQFVAISGNSDTTCVRFRLEFGRRITMLKDGYLHPQLRP